MGARRCRDRPLLHDRWVEPGSARRSTSDASEPRPASASTRKRATPERPRAADGAILPSVAGEGVSKFVLEALASGTPPLLSADRRGQAIEDGVTGLVFAAGDPASIAPALTDFAGWSPDRWAAASAACRASAEASYSLDVILPGSSSCTGLRSPPGLGVEPARRRRRCTRPGRCRSRPASGRPLRHRPDRPRAGRARHRIRHAGGRRCRRDRERGRRRALERPAAADHPAVASRPPGLPLLLAAAALERRASFVHISSVKAATPRRIPVCGLEARGRGAARGPVRGRFEEPAPACRRPAAGDAVPALRRRQAAPPSVAPLDPVGVDTTAATSGDHRPHAVRRDGRGPRPDPRRHRDPRPVAASSSRSRRGARSVTFGSR